MEYTANLKGARLEQQVATYFRLNGYAVELNAKLEGKSGALHEIDVLARKSDGITEFVLAIECKAWSTPIEKDVVSKLSMIISDIGINKGIIVSLQGWRSGAEKSAQQEKIELWGPEELTHHLGAVSLADLNAQQDNRYAIEAFVDALMPESHLRPMMESQSRGLLGFGREQEAWARLIWLPFHLVELHLSTMVKEFLRKPTIKTTPVWALYNALDDRHFLSMSIAPSTATQHNTPVIPAKTKPKALATTLTTTMKKFREVTTDNAKARYRKKLVSFGLAADALENLAVEQMTVIHYPFFAGMFRRRGNERLIAINAYTGKFDPTVSKSLTENMSFVSNAMGINQR
ncbi:MAG: restriction endonuclease [Thermaerobacter sp.]|nr:restriction endonuclease [Thermaerobacter sp.]